MSVILNKRKNEIEKNIANFNIELSKINYLLEENNMKNEIFIKDIPSYIIYYRDGMIEDFSKIPEFVLQAGTECAKANPNLKCITPDYCYISYLDGEYKEKGQDKITQYALAVNQGAMEFNQVPDAFKTAVYQRMNILENNKTANVIANTGANIGMFLLNPSAYLSGLLAQKGVAYTTDAISGRHEYNMGTVLGNTPVMGTNYQKENPGKSLLIDAATGIIGGTLLRNSHNIFNPS